MILRRAARILITGAAALAVAACAVRVGGGGAGEFDVFTLRADATVAPGEVATRLGGADIVLLSANGDSAWFAAVAEASGMQLSGPGRTGEIGMAFLTRLEMLGDTSLVLDVEDGGAIHMQDALYRVNGNRMIDLMMVRFDAPDLRVAVRRLLDYIAHDVAAHVPVLLAVDAATPQVADSAALLMRAYYSNDIECPGSAIADGEALQVRLLYGPSARIGCRASRLLPESHGTAIRATLGR